MEIHILNQQSALSLPKDQIRSIVKAVVSFEKKYYDEVAVHFVDKKNICELHALYFNDPSPTDCISFPMDDEKEEGYRVLGDIFVCPEVAIEYVQKHGGEAKQEVTLYIVHGLLHLMGYDDLEESQCQLMREAEQRHMENLKKQLFC